MIDQTMEFRRLRPEPGVVQLGPLLTHRFSASRAQQAFDLAERKSDGAVRVAVTFE